MTAARTGRAGPLRALLARGAAVNEKNDHGQTAIMWAAAEGHAEAVEILIQAGADFRAKLDSGFTPFLFAVREGHKEVVQAFLRAGVNIDEPIQPSARPPRRSPRPGSTALNLAIENGHFELAAFLLEHGANPHGGDVGFTPLHQISWVRKTNVGDDHDPVPEVTGSMTSIDLVRKLVAHGADVNALVTKHVRGLSRLNTLGATPFFMASRTADVELMQTLADLGADPRKPNADGSTPLMAAAGLGCVSPGEDPGSPEETLAAVALALKLGGDPNAVDANGDTAMHGAAYKNVPEVVEFLASHGAKISIWNRKNSQGWTPLTIAEGYRFGNFKPSPETVAAFHRVLLAAGVKPVSDPTAKSAQIY
jgi:ankyrin repeat protein